MEIAAVNWVRLERDSKDTDTTSQGLEGLLEPKCLEPKWLRMHACMHACMHARTHVCMHAYMHAHMHAYMHVFFVVSQSRLT